jgi:diguanylate cyclase (GGDEF)-like protein
VRRLSLATRCALASLVVVALLGCVLAVAVSRVVHAEATAEATRRGELVASFVSRGLAPAAFDRAALTPEERDVLDRVVAGTDELRGLRLWGRGGRVLYASQQQVTAKIRPVGPLLARAYDGEVVSQVADKGDGAVLQVFVPLRGVSAAGVVEVDLRHSATVTRTRTAVAALAALLGLGLGALWALLWWLSRVVTGALRRTAVEQEALALTDSLTGLPNRRALLAALSAGQPGALLLLDLDRFKEVNDTLGHAVGDRLLREVGLRLREHVRDQDVVARLGGDEFAVLLPLVADPEEAQATAGRLATALERPFDVEGLQLALQASTGIALAPRHARDGSELLQRADVAMYVAKRQGTGSSVYDQELDLHSPDRLLLLADLKEGLAAGELSLAYQPCYDLQLTGRCRAVEALVRWHSPKRGFVSPAEFVPLCERSGLVRDLTAYVLDEALRQLREWEDAGTTVNVAVNLSASNLAEEDLPELVAGLLARHRIPADRVVLEITESAVIPDPVRAARVLGRLVDLGLDIAIDDFGTGWSSMSRLLELPLSALKVDRSFVADLPRGAGAAVVSATTTLAHDLGLFVVAEGIETQEQLEHAVRLGCDVGQGYLLARPLPPAEVPAAVQQVVPHAVAMVL